MKWGRKKARNWLPPLVQFSKLKAWLNPFLGEKILALAQWFRELKIFFTISSRGDPSAGILSASINQGRISQDLYLGSFAPPFSQGKIVLAIWMKPSSYQYNSMSKCAKGIFLLYFAIAKYPPLPFSHRVQSLMPFLRSSLPSSFSQVIDRSCIEASPSPDPDNGQEWRQVSQVQCTT